MKRFAGILLIFTMITALFSAFIPTASAAKAYDGTSVKPNKISSYLSYGLNGSAYSTYLDWYAITNAAELYGFAELVNNGENKANAVLLNDITVNENVRPGSGAYSWTPIGTLKKPYNGIFDGAGHSISGLYFNDSSKTHVGLFGYVGASFSSSKAVIKNLILKNSYFRGIKNIGSIAGELYGYNVNITGCKVERDVIIDLYDDFNSSSDDVTSIGGIAGGYTSSMVGETSYITNCASFASITLTVDFSNVPNSDNLENLKGKAFHLGFITGSYRSSNNAEKKITLTKCYALKNSLKLVNSTNTLTYYYNIAAGSTGNHSSNEGCTILDSVSSAHDCISASAPAINATCLNDGSTAYSFCLLCEKVTSGTKKITPAGDDFHKYSGGSCSVKPVCRYCGETSATYNHTCDGYSYKAAGNSGHDIYHGCGNDYIKTDPHTFNYAHKCTLCSHTCTHTFEDGECICCGYKCMHSYTNGFCTICNDYQSALPVTESNCESMNLGPEYAGFYAISNGGNLYWFAQEVNRDGNREIKGVVTADIDLEERPWTPIGTTGENNNNFRGVFDGRGHTIRGLNVTARRNGVGFFGEVRTGTIKNFTLYGEVTVNEKYTYVGGVIGSACGLNTENNLERNGATIQNITSFVNVTANAHGIGRAGGFAGYANHETLIENCAWYGTFNPGKYRTEAGAAGFLGRIQENSTVTVRNCGAYGTVKTNYKSGDYNGSKDIFIGGFLGWSVDGSNEGDLTGTVIENCLFAGSIELGEDITDEIDYSAFGCLSEIKSITNCYYSNENGLPAVNNNSTFIPDETDLISVSKSQLASGEAAYMLGDAWGQKIGAASYPVPGGEKVYKYGEDYFNLYKPVIKAYAVTGSRVNVTFANPEKEKFTIIISDYENDALNNVDIITQEFDAGVNTVTSTKSITLGKDDKIMIWKDLNLPASLCEAYIVK